MGDTTFVTPHEEGWAVKGPNAKRAIAVYPTQAEAIERGKEVADNKRGELRVAGRDGKFRIADSHGHDPRRRKG